MNEELAKAALDAREELAHDLAEAGLALNDDGEFVCLEHGVRDCGCALPDTGPSQ